MGKYAPFEEAFNRFSSSKPLDKVKTFDELKELFQDWGGKKAPLTRKQQKALAVEGEKIGIESHVRQEKYFEKGKIKTRYRDVVTGSFVKGMSEKSILPSWRKSETVYVKGAKINTVTGEKIVIRDDKGKFLKKSEWKLYDKNGKEIKLD